MLGTIQNYTQSPSGQMNGFVLASGQRVRIPESMGAKVSDQFPPNTPVRVTGHMVTDTDGRPILEADELMNPTQQGDAGPDRRARATPPSPVPSSIGGSGAGGTPPDSSSTGTPSGATTAPASPGQQPPAGR